MLSKNKTGVYLYYLLSFFILLYIDFTYFPKVSLVGLYSVPLGLAGFYFSKRNTYVLAVLYWLAGLSAEFALLKINNFLSKTDLTVRYCVIAILFALISNLSIRFSRNHRLLEEKNTRLKILVVDILKALSSSIEAKDTYLRGHSLNVARISRDIAKNMGLNTREQERIFYAGLLHDIGKIGVKEDILNKPTTLTNEEYQEIKKHSEIGANIVEHINEFSDIVLYIKHHHERWDGSGYPSRLKSENIPLGARILSIADSFDAMISERLYKKQMSFNEALKEMNLCAGKQFDPEIVRLLMNNTNILNKVS